MGVHFLNAGDQRKIYVALNMKIALISPAWTTVFGPFSKIGTQAANFPPLGLCYLASLAREKGHEVKVIDAEVEMLGTERIADIISDFSPDLIGISSTTPMFHIARALAERLKKVSKAPIAVGGPHVSYYKEKVFDENFDFLCVGESESYFNEFLNCLEKGGDFSRVKGIVFRSGDKDVFTGNAQGAWELDTLPFPARDLLPVRKYMTNTVYHGRLNYTSILMSRGCPFKCVYCAAPSLSSEKVRWASPGRTLDEIEHVINSTGIRHFIFLDDTLTLKRSHIMEFCGEIEKRGVNFTWEGWTRTNAIDDELVSRMARNGFIRVSFGLESSDSEVRRIIRKELPLDSVRKANKLTAKYGVETLNSAMLGLPGDTKEKVWKTVGFIRNEKSIQHATFSIAMPYPGTEFMEMAKKGEHGLKLHTEDFSKYQRYGSAVLSVGDMTPGDIIRLQKLALLRIYFTPFRIRQIVRRFRFLPLVRPFLLALLAAMAYPFINLIKFLKGKISLEERGRI